MTIQIRAEEIRVGDRVFIEGQFRTVERVIAGRLFTAIRADSGKRLAWVGVLPNDKMQTVIRR